MGSYLSIKEERKIRGTRSKSYILGCKNERRPFFSMSINYSRKGERVYYNIYY
jgi:hypothetical protein